MLFSLIVSLYTSRILLDTLGIKDFGIYNLVGGVVVMLSFFNSSMISVTQRFLSFELGKKDYHQLTRVFSMSLNIHLIIGILVILLAETLGLWFLNTQLNIAEERMISVNYVYQFSVLSFFISVVTYPYSAVVIAYERMNVFAWISILEVSLKLLIVLMLSWLSFDKLKLYALLLLLLTLIVRITYFFYTRANFSKIKYTFFWDKSLFKELINYSGWSLWGNTASVFSSQGINILLNIFFDTVINAARGIAYQIEGAVKGFVINLQMAINPQIIKSYAARDMKYMYQLIFQGAKYSFFLLFFICYPIILNTEFIIKLWLVNFPKYTIIFTKLILVNALINSLSGSLRTAVQATGKIKLFQIIVGGMLLLNLPISYIFLKLGFSPEIVFYISITLSILTFWSRLFIASLLVGFSVIDFLINVLMKIFFTVALSYFINLLLIKSFNIITNYPLIKIFMILFVTMLSIILTGLSTNERKYILKQFKK